MLTFEKGRVTGGTVRNAMSQQFIFAAHPLTAPHGAGGQDHHLARIGAVVGEHLFGAGGEVRADDLIRYILSAVGTGLFAHGVQQVSAADGVQQTGVIGDLAGDAQRARGETFIDDKGR
ncbi:hypothetical protein SDC9_98348 [bioreactor metagenome]|uniref:Uncharacterized protein n=1 Tax=bioreactor metagenome TaxID=1076179 RepID=A0A645AEI7_9ZZZZ